MNQRASLRTGDLVITNNWTYVVVGEVRFGTDNLVEGRRALGFFSWPGRRVEWTDVAIVATQPTARVIR